MIETIKHQKGLKLMICFYATHLKEMIKALINTLRFDSFISCKSSLF